MNETSNDNKFASQQKGKDLLDLCSSLYDKSTVALQGKINQYLEDHTGAQISFLVPSETADGDPKKSEAAESLYIQVISKTSRNSPIRLQGDHFHFGQSTAEDPSNNSVLEPIYLKHLTPAQIDYFESILSVKLTTFMAVPIYDSRISSSFGLGSKKIHLIACLVNRKNGLEFGQKEAVIVRECFKVTLGILLNSLAYEEERRLKNQCQSLLTVARNLFTHLDDVTVLLGLIMSEARNLTQAERCSLFLVDTRNDELIAKVFDGDVAQDKTNNENGSEVRLPLTQGIAGHVAKTGKLLNIKDAQHHPLFYRNIDQATGFTTRNILCFPIKDGSEVIGVAELCNKNNGLYFSKFDEEIALAFSAYCGISIMHSLMFKKVADAQHRSKLSNELMMYHMKVPDEDVSRLVLQRIPAIPDIHPNFCRFSFTPRELNLHHSPSIVYSLFQSLGLVNRFRIPEEVLARFILMVRRGYRDPPYHNWMHAFSVAHFCFLIITNCRLVENKLLSDLEVLALLVACLCHDLDHRGTNNSFQLASNSVLAALYSSEGSVMERHHLAQTMCILNTEGCNVLENLGEKDYMRCLDLLRDIILATDLAHHFRIKPNLEQMIDDGYNPNNMDHRALLLSLLMTSCDLSDQAKDWSNSKDTAELIYSEFFCQGDLEKAMGNKPQPSMDREKANVPSLQIEFIDQIALPVYRSLYQMFPEAEEPLTAVQNNRICWGQAHEALVKRGRKGITGNVKDIFRDESIEREVASVARQVREQQSSLAKENIK